MLTFTDEWKVNEFFFNSRLLLGTGRFENLDKAKRSIDLSEPSLVTVAVRRIETGIKGSSQDLMGLLDWSRVWMLPNTAGSKTPDEAIRLA